MCVCLCVCDWSPVRKLYLNYEVVVFQPHTGTPPHLGSVAIVTNFISIPPAPPDSNIFLDCYFPSSVLLPPPHQQPFIFVVLYFLPSPQLLSHFKSLPTWMFPTPAGLRRSSLRPAPHACICRRLPWRCVPPFCCPRPSPSSLSAPGVFVFHGSLCLPCASASPSLSYPPNPHIFWFLVSCRVAFRAR